MKKYNKRASATRKSVARLTRTLCVKELNKAISNMLLIIEKKPGNIHQCKGKGPKAELLCNWLESDVQQSEDNALTALEYIEKSDSGEEQFWGGNAFMVDFLRHSVVLKYQYGDKEICNYTKKEIVKALKNLLNTDYAGTWVTHGRTSVQGEKQTLIINKDNSSYFERNFDDNNQKFNSPASLFTQQEDLLIIKYNNKPNDLRYKLVLSGWRSGDTYALYGFMYMYSEGKQFNGLPVSFRRQ